MKVAAEPNAKMMKQSHLVGVDERNERRPLRNEHTERRDEHAHDAEHHQARKTRHALEKKIHVLDVAASDMMLGSSHAQEQKRLRNGMEQNEEDRRPDRLRRTDPPRTR